MKKIILTITLIVSALLLTGCGNNTYIEKIDYSQFQKMLENKESFILEIVQDGCSACEDFSPRFDKILKEHDIKAKSISTTTLSDTDEKEFNNQYQITGTPTVIFFKDGVETSLLNRINGSRSDDVINSKLKANGYIK